MLQLPYRSVESSAADTKGRATPGCNGFCPAHARARNLSIFSRTVASCSPRSAAWPCTSATTAGGALSTNFLLARRACSPASSFSSLPSCFCSRSISLSASRKGRWMQVNHNGQGSKRRRGKAVWPPWCDPLICNG